MAGREIMELMAMMVWIRRGRQWKLSQELDELGSLRRPMRNVIRGCWSLDQKQELWLLVVHRICWSPEEKLLRGCKIWSIGLHRQLQERLLRQHKLCMCWLIEQPQQCSTLPSLHIRQFPLWKTGQEQLLDELNRHDVHASERQQS